MMKKSILIACVVGASALGAGLYAYTLYQGRQTGIVSSNGRIEAQTVDIATRTSARVEAMPVQEGDMVDAGTVVARLDLSEMDAALEGAEANVRYSHQRYEGAQSAVTEAQAAVDLADKEFQRASTLLHDGHISQSRYDQALNAKQSADAALSAARQNLGGLAELVAVADADVARLNDLLRDKELRAPVAGRVLYRLIEPGEIVAAGARVATIMDLSDVYMTVFLSADVIAHIKVGDEARLLIDALPKTPIPAYVSYISPEAQFTPRQVETRSERDKLTFRVKVRIPVGLLRAHREQIKTGLPGLAYVRTAPDHEWPVALQPSAQLIQEAQASVP